MNRAALQAYGTQQVMTSSPVELVALLYGKAIVSLKEAIQAIENNEIEKRWKANNKAFEIINHLSLTLDQEKGGEIAENLSDLYNFMLNRLSDVDLKNDPQAARDVIVLLEPLHASWRQLAKNGGQAEPQSAAAKGNQVPAGYGQVGHTPQPEPKAALSDSHASKSVKLSA